MILEGIGGSGKTYLIQCLKKRFPGQILLAATTGLAASHIGGRTIHSLLNLPVKSRN